MTLVPKRAGAADPKSAVAQKLVFEKHATAPVAAAPWQREGHKQTEQDLDNRSMVRRKEFFRTKFKLRGITRYRKHASINFSSHHSICKFQRSHHSATGLTNTYLQTLRLAGTFPIRLREKPPCFRMPVLAPPHP